MEKAEDYMRSTMGMPPRDKKKRKSSTHSGNKDYRSNRNRSKASQEPIIPKEYAEDVEFTEIIEYSEKEYIHTKNGTEVYHESQISDAEYIEIKKNSTEQHG